VDGRKKQGQRRMRRPMFPLYRRRLENARQCQHPDQCNDNEREEMQGSSPSEEETVINDELNEESSQFNDAEVAKNNQYEEGRPTEINETTFAQAVKMYYLGIDGDKEAVIKAHELFKKLYKENSNNHLIEAYYGSATALLGRDVIDPTERFKKVLKGNKILDHAVASDPENHEIRILRGYVSYRLPEMYFHRTTKAVEDFNYLVSQYEQDSSIFSREFYWQLLFDLGTAYKTLEQENEAESTWTKLLSLTTDPKYRELLKQEGMPVDDVSVDTANAEGLSKTQEVIEKKEETRQEESHGEEFSAEGIKLHSLALEGDEEATHKGFELFEKIYREKPHDPQVMAYYADHLSMTGRDSKNPTDMFANAIKAMKMLDKAVNARPDDLNIRLIRANQSYRLPEPFFRRTATAVEDFEYLAERYEQDNSVLPPETFQEILYKMGNAYKRLEMDKEAKSAWLKLKSLDQEQKYTALLDEQQDEDKTFSLKGISMNDKDRLVKEAIRLHDRGVAGNKKAVKKAYDLLQKAHEKYPEDPIIMGYYGSCMALVGRDSQDPKEMFGNGIKGLVLLKKAIGKDWSNPHLRVLRGYLAYNLPDVFFPMTERAIKDLRFVKSACEEDSSLFSEEFYCQVLYDLGVAYRRLGDKVKAQKVWTKLLKVAPESKYQDLVALE